MQSDSPDVRMHYDSSEDNGAFFSADEGDAPLSRKDFTRLRSDVTTALKHFEEYKGEVAGVIKTCFQEQQQALRQQTRQKELTREQEQESQDLLPKNAGRESFNESVQVSGS